MTIFKYMLLILLPLVVIFGYSVVDNEIVIMNFPIEKNGWALEVKDRVLKNSNSNKHQDVQLYAVSSKDLDLVPNDTTSNNKVGTQEIQTSLTSTQISNEVTKQITNAKKESNTTAKQEKINANYKIMIIGDSMVQGLQPHMERLAKEHNTTMITRFKIGSSSFYWANQQNIKNDIETINPNLVLIVLGSNEWQGSANPKLKRAIRKIADDIGATNTPYIWIGPPIKDAQSYQEMLAKVVNPSKLYDYTELNVTRGKDQIHPSPKGFSQWTNMILTRVYKEEYIARN